MTTDRESNVADWLRRAIIKIFYDLRSHLAQTFTLLRSHCDKITMAKLLVRGQLTWLKFELPDFRPYFFVLFIYFLIVNLFF